MLREFYNVQLMQTARRLFVDLETLNWRRST